MVRVVILGLGVQGRKRRGVAARDCVGTIDPVVEDADYKSIDDVAPASYDAAILCVPDDAKRGLVTKLVSLGKHLLVEKPLDLGGVENMMAVERQAHATGSRIVTAYNHRFEPHIATVKQLLADGAVGEVYRCNLFYGNGTAQLVRNSGWRDRGAGVIPDLASHLLDIVDFWFDRSLDDVNLLGARTYENLSPDHAVIASSILRPDLLLEISLLSWRNTFQADVVGSEGSLHIRSLCKWSDSELVIRKRTRPSGLPAEERIIAPQGDPTWGLEYEAFVKNCQSRDTASLRRDIKIAEALDRLNRQASEGES